MTGARRFAGARVLLLGWLGAIAGFAAVAVCCVPLDALLRDLSCDDSFYYGGIARELATTGSSSFDGLHPTNGYHPLWLWLQTPVHWLWHDAVAALRATRVLEILLVLLAATLWLSALWRAGLSVAAAAWLCVYFVREHELVIGMDAGTAVLMLGAAAFCAGRYLAAGDVGRRRLALLCGVALAAAALARLDQLAFSAALGGWLLLVWWRRRAPDGTRDRLEAALLLGPPVLALGVYLLANQWCFDSALPVSGLTKQLWSSGAADAGFERFARRLAELLRTRDVRDGLVFGAVLVAVSWFRARRLTRGPGDAALLPIATALFALALAKTAYYAWTVEPELANYVWYFTSGSLTRYLTIALLLDVLLRWLRSRAATAASVAALSVVAVAAVLQVRAVVRLADRTTRTMPDWEMLSHDAVEWLREHAPHEAVVGSFDAGVLGYFRRGPVTNLDGLVNSRAFLEARRRGEPLAAFLEHNRIDWLANVAERVEHLRQKGVPDSFEVVHEGPRQRCIDGVERSVFVLRRR